MTTLGPNLTQTPSYILGPNRGRPVRFDLRAVSVVLWVLWGATARPTPGTDHPTPPRLAAAIALGR